MTANRSGRLVLASTSPRRREILQNAGLLFETVDPGDEGEFDSLDPAERVLLHARAKARSVAESCPDAYVLASDTLVWKAGLPLGKPANRSEAAAMLGSLSDSEHEVWTGICLIAPGGKRYERADLARVAFDPIPAEPLAAYLEGDEWADKAGAYGIQGTAGRWARVIEGEFETVMGISAASVRELLRLAGACLEALQG